MSLPELSVRRPITTLMFYAALVIMGYISFQKLSVNFLPEIQTPRLTVKTAYRDASPDEVMRLITEPIEQTLQTMSGVRKIRSVSREGISVVQADFYWGTDMSFALIDAREKLDRLKAALPKEAERPNILRIDPSSEPIMTIVVVERSDTGRNAVSKADRLSESQRRAQALYEASLLCETFINRRLEQLDGVAQARAVGSPVREIQAIINTRVMSAFGLSLQDVAAKLAAQNISAPMGTIKDGNFRYPLRAESEFKTLSDIENAIVGRTKDERLILFKDIAKITDAFAQSKAVTLYNGVETIEIQIRKEASANTVETSRRIKKLLKELEGELGRIRLEVAFDQAEFIQRSIDDLVGSIYLGAFLAFFVLFFFLNELRYSLLVAVTTPISIIITFILMYAFNVNINIISLTGVALGIGMLGDNAIIVIENISRLRDEGVERREAIIEGTKEINLAAAASTFTNVAIFLPVIFTDGIAREIFRDMGLTMTFSLLSSLLVSVTLVPTMLSIERRGNQPSILTTTLPFWTAVSESILDWRLEGQRVFIRRYEQWLKIILENRKTTLFISFIILAATAATISLIPSETIPRINQGRFSITMNFPKGYDVNTTTEAVKFLISEMFSISTVEAVLAEIGASQGNDEIFSLENARTENTAELEVKLRESSNEKETIEKLRLLFSNQSKFDFQYSIQRKRTTLEQIFRPEKDDIKLKVISTNLDSALVAATTIKNLINKIPEVKDLRTGLEQTNPEYRLSLDYDAISRYDIDVKQLLNFIEYTARGVVATMVRESDEKISLRLKPEHTLLTLNDILSREIMTKNGFVPIRFLVHVATTNVYSQIFRENGKKEIVMLANASQNTSVTSVVETIERRVKASGVLSSAVSLEIGGENEEINASFRSLIAIVLLSLLLVYMILSAEFESIIYPLVILLTSPLAVIGALLAMLLFGQTFNAMSLIGIVIMVGAVDNDAVIATDFIIELRRRGVALTQAIFEGVSKRLRAIVMTTLTTVMGIIPLAFNLEGGSQLATALTIPLVGGLISATLFTLITIPVVYYYLDRESSKPS